MKVVIASTNKGKIDEIRRMLADLRIKFLSIENFPHLPVIVENGTTFEENAIKKAKTVCEWTGKITIGEDSGLEVDCLGGAPGIKSARFGGDGLTDTERNIRLLKLLKGISLGERRARFKCVLAIACPDGRINTVCGECQGLISLEVRGNQGFGYDPIFIPDGYSKTFGELGSEIKDKLSHRLVALSKAKEILLDIISKVKQK